MTNKIRLILITLVLAVCCPAVAGAAVLPDSVEHYTRRQFKARNWQAGKKMLDAHWADYGDLAVMNELMGQYFYNLKEYDKARFYLVRALREDFTNTQARELIANVEEETGNYSSAICYVNEILENNPYSQGWWRRKINLYRKQGNHLEADRLLERLRRIYPDDQQVKNDVTAMHEVRLKNQKLENDVQGQISSLRELIEAQPKETDYYLSLANLLLQTGRVLEAEEVLARGIRATGNPALIRKRAGILGDQGRYSEAVNYLRSMQSQYRLGSLASEINKMEMAAAEAAVLNDPYSAMARVYAKQHDREALNYLLNTSISRGYYGDALMYIEEAKGKGPGTEQLLYKEYTVHKRLGNQKAALGVLLKMYERFPDNTEVKDELSAIRYEEAIEMMNMQEYGEAIPLLEFAEANSSEADIKRSSLVRLFNCFFETKDYEGALQILGRLHEAGLYDTDDYDMHRANLLMAQGKNIDALRLLEQAYNNSTNQQKKKLIAYQYEELAQPYIKDLIQKGMIRVADRELKTALTVCPTSNDFLHQAITCADILGDKEGYNARVMAGRVNYPDDPFFIVKEAAMMGAKGNYRGALDMLRPQMDIFIGDSTLTGAFAENSLALANEQIKEKEHKKALATLDSALYFRPTDNELLYTKGLVYEAMHDYKNAYSYLKRYKPTLMDFQEHKRHLEELQAHDFVNEVTFSYQKARPGSEDIITSNAFASYMTKRGENSYTFNLGYAGRDGVEQGNLGKEDTEAGGAGFLLGLDWSHQRIGSKWSYSLGGSWGSRYFPKVTVRAQVGYDIKPSWTVDVHASARMIKTFTRRYEWQPNPEKYLPEDPDSVYVATGWNGKNTILAQAGIGVQHEVGQWNLAGSLDAFMMSGKPYFNGNLKAQFFPVEGSRTAIYATGGAGSAPQTELLDNSMPAGFSKLNTYVGAGLLLFFNRHIAGSIAGTWYNMYRSQTIQTGIWSAAENIVTSTMKTDYKNMFYLQGQVVISF